MKKIKLLVATIAMVMVSTVTFGQTPGLPVLAQIPDGCPHFGEVTVEWGNDLGTMHYSNTVSFTSNDINANGLLTIFVPASPSTIITNYKINYVKVTVSLGRYGEYKGYWEGKLPATPYITRFFKE